MDGIYLIVNQDTLSMAGLLILFAALAVAFLFEFINGFHDTANAVATVIYTRSLTPTPAILLSGLCNFLGVLLGGIGVAYTIVHLLPAGLLVHSTADKGLLMVYSLLLASILWNFGTWFKGLPASSSHTMIGAIIGVGFVDAIIRHAHFGSDVTWHNLTEVFVSLLLSPVIGFCLAALCFLGLKRWVSNEYLNLHPYSHLPPELLRDVKVGSAHARPPHFGVRFPMVLSSMAVSFAHGANDGQKGMGIIMLILIGLLPANFALDKGLSPAGYARISGAMANIEDVLLQQRAKQPSQSDLQKARMENVHQFMTDHGVAPMVMLDFTPLIKSLEETRKVITAEQVHKLSKDATWELRMTVLMIDESVTDLIRSKQLSFSPKDIEVLTENQKVMRSFAEYVPIWVMFGVAIALGAGTMIGWKRIVVTVGEKIGKTQMTYAQGLTASVVTAGTIALGNFLSLPVSTTHVLSSSVAGTMSANKVGLQVKTVKNILLAWVLTFPAAVVLAGVIYALLLAVVHG